MSAYSVLHCSYILWKSENEQNADMSVPVYNDESFPVNCF